MQEVDLNQFNNYVNNYANPEFIYQEYACNKSLSSHDSEDAVKYVDDNLEDVSCCPLEMLHKKRHSLSYKPNVKRGSKKVDVSRIPKFRNPWDVQGDLQPKKLKDSPLSYEEARFIREIWQDTRAQYYPSDGEIEEEFLFEEEYDDIAAEKRRSSLIEKGANLVRYTRHYELPTISTIIKSTNPEQFRSRSFSPLGDRINRNASNRRFSDNSKFSQKNNYNNLQNIQNNEELCENDYYNNINDRTKNSIFEQANNRHSYNSIYGKNNGRISQGKIPDIYDYDTKNSILENVNFDHDVSVFRNNSDKEVFHNTKDHNLINIPSFSNIDSSQRRNTIQGTYLELNHGLKSSTTSRRATSPEPLSPTKSTNRGPPPKIGILEPIETSQGLVSPVNHHRLSTQNTPRMGGITSRSSKSSRLTSNFSKQIEAYQNSNISENIPIISPNGKQTIVFHMMPDSENSNSKATIFANPDTQNIVTELHITPGVDINVISTPNGPAIEYEISGGRNAKAHINFSSNSNPDIIMNTNDIPKIQPPNNSIFEDRSFENSVIHENADLKLLHNQRSPNRKSPKNINSQVQKQNSEPNQDLNNHSLKDDFITNLKMENEQRGFIHQLEEDNKFQKKLNSQTPEVTKFSNNKEQFEEKNQEFNCDDNLQDQISFNENDLIDYKEQNVDLLSNKNNSNTKNHPSPFIPIKRIQKRSGFAGCIINTLTCSKVEASELKTFRALSPVEMVNRSSEYY